MSKIKIRRKAFGVKKFCVIVNSPECLCVNIWGLGLLIDKNRRVLY